MKKFKKLSLNKETIVKLNKDNQRFIKGGASDSITMECCVETAFCLTYGNCDLWSVGHDDGSICFSQTGFLCGGWCYGR